MSDLAAPGSTGDDAGFGPVRHNQTLTFVVVTLTASWSWWAFAALVLADGALTRALILPGGFGPLVGGLVTSWAAGEGVRSYLRSLARWRVEKRWYLAALALPLALAAGGTAAFLAAGATLDPSVLASRLPLFPVVLVFALLVGGGQEEPGWRGFALPRLQATHGALTASLAIGVVWAVWHLPLFLTGAARNATGSFGVYVAMVVPISVVLTWLYNETGGSVLVAALAHAGVNASGVLYPLAGSTASEFPLVADLSLAGVLWVLAAALVARHGHETLCSDDRVTAAAGGDDGGDRAASGLAGTAD